LPERNFSSGVAAMLFNIGTFARDAHSHVLFFNTAKER
jgi:hypothetical protein